jgi:enterochelin esterase-like enzyme
MPIEKLPKTRLNSHTIPSGFLEREVTVDFYIPPSGIPDTTPRLLLINDGQDLPTMDFCSLLDRLYAENSISPVLCAGIHCGADRKSEYGTAGIPDYKGRGAKAALYTRFVLEELLPFTRSGFAIPAFRETSFCGFSLGGLSALDIVWNHPREFVRTGVFSGSLWWRTVSQDDEHFTEEEHRIMHLAIRNGGFYPWLKFFFETGTLDETADRNKNGIIDSIDDTQSLIGELRKKGYDPQADIRYMELKDGRHDVATWAKAFPEFLKWGWGK